MSDFDPAAYGRFAADDYDRLVENLDPGPAVETLVKLAEGQAVLEFGIGSGRLALPLAEQGVEVAGVDGSPDMVELLHAKPGAADIRVEIGDFSTTRVPGEYGLVVLAINTIYALPDQDAQVRCFANAAAHLGPGGRFLVEAWVPDPGAFRRGQAVRVLDVRDQRVLLEIAQLLPSEQHMRTTKLLVSPGGVRMFPANHRYAWPQELDLMARMAGLTLEHRWQDWQRTPYDDDSTTHVSVWRKP